MIGTVLTRFRNLKNVAEEEAIYALNCIRYIVYIVVPAK
jgi:hypothetical protein